jgi:hypothetical protein
MCVLQLDVHLHEEVSIHEMSVGIWVSRGKPNVFVQVERAATCKIKPLFAVHPDEMTINSLHRVTRGETEDGARICAHFVRDNPGREQRRCFFVALNDEFHERIKPNRLRLTTKNHMRR